MKKVVSVLIIMIIMLGMLTQSVRGLSFNFVVTPSDTEVESGETVTINLRVANIDAGELGINTVQCIFKYDETMFEDVKVRGNADNNWSVTYNNQVGNENYGTLLAVTISDGVTQDQDIGSISLKVKDGMEGRTGNITFTQVATNDGTNIIPDTDKTITITVKGDAVNPEPDTNTENVVDNTNPVDTNNNDKGDSSTTKLPIASTKENMSTGTLPQTGDKTHVILICAVTGVVAGIIAFFQYKHYKDVKQK